MQGLILLYFLSCYKVKLAFFSLLSVSEYLFYFILFLFFYWTKVALRVFPCNSVGKKSACNAGDLGSIPGWGRSPGEGNGNPLQCSSLQNPMDRGAWQAAVHGVTRVGHDLMTKPPPKLLYNAVSFRCIAKCFSDIYMYVCMNVYIYSFSSSFAIQIITEY